MITFDVKSMFTDLDKEAVLEAVTWILTKNPGWRRGARGRQASAALVSWEDGKVKARVGVGMKKKEGEKSIPLKVVLEIVRFDLEESVMKAGRHFLWQCAGIPMGSFLSALLAGITVAVREHRFYQREPKRVTARVEGVRYAVGREPLWIVCVKFNQM